MYTYLFIYPCSMYPFDLFNWFASFAFARLSCIRKKFHFFFSFFLKEKRNLTYVKEMNGCSRENVNNAERTKKYLSLTNYKLWLLYLLLNRKNIGCQTQWPNITKTRCRVLTRYIASKKNHEL